MTVEIFLSDFQSIANGIFRIFIFNDRYLVFMELFFCCSTVEQLFAFTLHCFAVRVCEWDGWEWE